MTRHFYLLLFLGITMIPAGFGSYHFINAQTNSSEGNLGIDIIQPITPTSVLNNIQGDDQGIHNPSNWTVVSGNWTISDSNLNGGSLENTTSVLHNTILNPGISGNPSGVSTSIKVNNLDTSTANYVSIVFSFIDPDNYKLAGINIYDNTVYAVGYSIVNGTQVAEPYWPGIPTDLTWSPGAMYNVTLVNQDSSLDLFINGTKYLTQSIDSEQIDLKDVGLNYGRIQDISFLDFKAGVADPQLISQDVQNFTTRDTQTILLEGESFPEDSYIHLYDSSPYQIASGHIVAKLPCDDDNNTEINVLTGQAPNLAPIELEYISDLSTSGELCLYRADVSSSSSNPITDVAIGNNSTDDIDFPDTSSVVISVGEMSKMK